MAQTAAHSTPRRQRRIFRPHEAAQLRADREACESALQSPHVQNKEAVRKALGNLSKMEAEHGVPDLSPLERDKAKKQIGELETQIKEGMLSHEEMRRNPPGAVDQNVWWERRNKRRINRWKNLQLVLHRDIAPDQAQDLINIERLRPRTNHLNMDNAQIPVSTAFSFPSSAFMANYDAIFKKSSAAEDEPEYLTEPEPAAPAPLLEDDGEE